LDLSKLYKVSIANTGIDISNNKLVKEADIIHLHWINQGFLSLNDIKKIIALKKPILWTLHDMWPITGICHHSFGCNKFEKVCGKCELINSKKEYDLSTRVFKKKKFLENSNIYLVSVSSWLNNMARNSLLTKNLNSEVIPNVIDSEIFKPGSKIEARKHFSIPLNKKVLLMGAAKLDDQIKGGDYLQKAIELLSEKENYLLILFGNIKNKKDSFVEKLTIPYIHFGVLSSNEKIALLYATADVVVVPSLYETFGQTIIEAMSCGRPAVSFNNSGQTDIIDHKQNGYLAEYLNVYDFSNGIEWILNNDNPQAITDSCLEKVKLHYTENIVANQYKNIYSRLLEQK
jgi:glycosyltransferase involved in cell wall biosynthesis